MARKVTEHFLHAIPNEEILSSHSADLRLTTKAESTLSLTPTNDFSESTPTIAELARFTFLPEILSIIAFISFCRRSALTFQILGQLCPIRLLNHKNWEVITLRLPHCVKLIVYVVSALVKAGRIKFRQRFHSYRQQTQDTTLTALPFFVASTSVNVDLVCS